MWRTIAVSLALSSAANAQTLKVVQAKLDKKVVSQAQYTKHVECAGEDDDCGGLVYAASSTLAPEKRAKYDAKNLNDGLLSTAWCEGVPGYGTGQTFTLTLDTSTAHPAWSGKIEIMNGYANNTKLFAKNGRIKTLKVSLNDAPLANVQLVDALGLQSFSLFDVLPKGTDTRGAVLKFEIVEVYNAGAKAEDTCVSELRPAGCVP